jgi:hypothetical protein
MFIFCLLISSFVNVLAIKTTSCLFYASPIFVKVTLIIADDVLVLGIPVMVEPLILSIQFGRLLNEYTYSFMFCLLFLVIYFVVFVKSVNKLFASKVMIFLTPKRIGTWITGDWDLTSIITRKNKKWIQ